MVALFGAAALALLVACGSAEEAGPDTASQRPASESAASGHLKDPRGDARPASVDIVEVSASRSSAEVKVVTRLAGRPFVNQPTSDETGVYAVQITSGERTWTVMASSTVDGDEFSVAPLDLSEANPARDIPGKFTRNGWTATVPASVFADAQGLEIVFDAEFVSIAGPGSTDTAPDKGSLRLP